MKIHKLPLILITFFCIITNRLSAQTGFFLEDSKGESSLILPSGGIVRINTSDESLKFGYYSNKSEQKYIYGFDVKGKSNNGLTPIFNNEKLSQEANLSFIFGIKNITTRHKSKNGRYDNLNFKFEIGEAKYKLINTNTTYEQQVKSKSFNKINLGLAYNYFLNGNMIFGIYGGYNRNNNISDLTKLNIEESTIISTDPTGEIIRTSKEEYTAWKGDFKTINQVLLFIDYVYIPEWLSNRVALSLYSRSNFKSTINQTNGGIGIYLNKKNEPSKIVGGIIYEFEDLFNSKSSGASFINRGTLGIVVGYNFFIK